ncbi:phage major capsid protein [Lysobacter firmicutimachus]|uniref:Phage major capsid protein n=1 Tax=Lysobacter firmicutimachus TaxID=1792846 RepID=A0AAU8MRA9_9GAMM
MRAKKHLEELEMEELKRAVIEGVDSIRSEVKARFASFEDRIIDLEQKKGTGHPDPAMANGGNGPGFMAVKALSEDAGMVAARTAAQQNKKISSLNSRVSLDVSIKSILTNLSSATSSGSATFPTPPDRNPNITIPGLRPLRLLDVLPRRPTSSDSVEYVRLAASGEASEQEIEGETKAELDLEGTLDTASIVTIAGWTAASRQVLADNDALGAAIDTVINHKCLSRLEHRLINGVGGQGKIAGLLHLGTAFSPTIATTPADAVGESMVTMANAGYMPNLILLNPLDWFSIQITRSSTAEYIFGTPTNPVPPALWNSAIVTTPSVPLGTGITLDTRFTTVLDRQQMSVLISNSHADFFVRNLVAILGELRAGLEVTDSSAVYHFGLPATSSGP